MITISGGLTFTGGPGGLQILAPPPPLLDPNVGVTWSNVSGNLTSAGWSSSREVRGLAYNGTVFMATGSNSGTGPNVATSTNGSTWINRGSVPNRGGTVSAALNVGSTFYIFWGAGRASISTDNGITWSTNSSYNTLTNASGFNFNAAGTDGTMIVAFGYDSNGNLLGAYTSNAASWTNVSFNTKYAGVGEVRGVAYGNNKWVAVGTQGNVYYSTDGINWTYTNNLRTTVSSNTMYDVVFSNNTFTAVGANNRIATSTNGSTWVSQTANSSFGLNIIRAAHVIGDKIIAVGDGGRVQTNTSNAGWIYQSGLSATGYSSQVPVLASSNTTVLISDGVSGTATNLLTSL